MRKILMTAVALLVVSTAPGMARDYAWCSRTPSNAGNPKCDFSSFPQCQATVSGQGGDCIQNPRLAYGQAGSWHNNPGGNVDWSDRGWDHRW